MVLAYKIRAGQTQMCTAICTLCDKQKPENILVTHGTFGANILVHKILVSAGGWAVPIRRPVGRNTDAEIAKKFDVIYDPEVSDHCPIALTLWEK